MMKKLFNILSIIFLSIVFISCEKQAGEGGTSTIQGKVYAKKYDGSLSILREEFYIPDERVYIIYGDDSIYSDDFRTNYDGSYEFKYLRKGKYRIYAFSKNLDKKTSVQEIPVFVEVEITDNKQTVQATDIIIIK